MSLLNIYLLIMTIIIGLCVGSFLNVVIYRLPREMSLSSPPSHCPNCNYKLRWYDNIPVFSYIFLGGKCRNCRKPISPRYICVEILNMALWLCCLLCFTDVIIKTNENDYVFFAVSCLSCSAMIAVFFSDLENMIIPDELQVFLLILGLIGMFSQHESTSIAVFGFLFGGGVFYLVYFVSYKITKRECMGLGDVKLMAVLGLILGIYNIIMVIVISCVVGAIVLLILNKIKKEGKNKEYPFAIFLVPAAVLILFVGHFITDWYFLLLNSL